MGGFPLVRLVLLLCLGRGGFGLVEDASFSFSFQSFKEEGIELFGDAAVVNSSVRINEPKAMSGGRVMYSRRLAFGRKPSFSTYFCFSMSQPEGRGLVFLMAPTGTALPLDGRAAAGVFAVELSGSRVSVSLGGGWVSLADASKHGLALRGGEKVHAWIDYGGDSRLLKVALSKARTARPSAPLASYPVDLSGLIWKNSMAVGFAASSGNSTQTAALHAWDFSLKHAAAYLMHSEPLDPRTITGPPARTRDYLPGVLLGLVFGAVSGALGIILLLSAWLACFHRPTAYSVHPVDCQNEKVPPSAKL